ncbi:PucR C-terminal helix-turn-helix domain-containing protein [Marinactinospora thermotolerans DSM 45154]|uniref:PucR C-terminal helix-turn-helix domain-containing protein n=1 Tax=Marinactinospora thermotolerans DSM 45154 TaxID=1122192 RepID=A0A1T4RF07_9ACTN|nr:helix-turn-helix domain-containing protein [Marinactinospora thermotolerans]SKA14457.1 PucR C-terminal helix-turn-helix domain-containing protein [Marinactinospora thermotolerans DSM 45154]
MRFRDTEPSSRPWEELPAELADILEPEVEVLAEEIVQAILAGIPEFARPLNDVYGRTVRLGVERALHHFLDLVRGPSQTQVNGERIYRRLGRNEFREGRSLDALHSAYRLGTRIAWRRLARRAERAGQSAAVLALLAEAVFAYLDGIAAESLAGYAEAQARSAGAREHFRRRLLTLLLAEPAADRESMEMAARLAGWRLPDQVACVALRSGVEVSPTRRLRMDADHLLDTDRPDPCLLVPAPVTEQDRRAIEDVLGEEPTVIGPVVDLHEASLSFRWAKQGLNLRERGILPGEGLLSCDDHLLVLLLFQDERLLARLGERSLGPFEGLAEKRAAKLAETLLAWLVTRGGGAPETAAMLGVHPQTVRYRMNHVERLFGDRLRDPQVRFELEMVLRARRLRELAGDGR